MPADTARLADELADTLRRTVEGCFEALLEDPQQLAELAGRLRAAGEAPPRGTSPSGASSEDFAAVVDAIALMDRRLGELEDRLRVLAEVTGTVARAVEGLRAGPGGGGEPAPAEESPADDDEG